jgi:Na+/H+-dicarboxylate symporter
MTLSTRIFAGLAAGLVAGVLASASGSARLISVVTAVEPAGTIWINLIRMVVIPLVVAALVSGVAAIGDPRRLGRLGVRTLAFYWGTVLIAALVGLLVAAVLVPLAPFSPEAAAALREQAASRADEIERTAQGVRGIGQWLLELVPTNPVKAAADGSLLPLIVFTVLFGAALGAADPRSRAAVVGLADAVLAALIRLIGWIMALAPIGVACLVAPVAARFGLEVLKSLAVFIVAVVGGTVLVALGVFGSAAKLMARVGPLEFTRAIAPGTTVGFTTASSLAALPAMMETATGKLRISPPVASFVLPLGAALNRPGTAVYHLVAVMFVASLYGVSLDAGRLVMAILSTFLMTFSVAAVPSATVFTLAPTLLAVGLPVEGIALLLGVDRVPDMFRTGLNCAGHQTAAAVVARLEGEMAA